MQGLRVAVSGVEDEEDSALTGASGLFDAAAQPRQGELDVCERGAGEHDAPVVADAAELPQQSVEALGVALGPAQRDVVLEADVVREGQREALLGSGRPAESKHEDAEPQ